MKSAAITLALLAVMATAALAQSGDFGVPINPAGPGNSAPTVHLSARAIDIGIDIDGSGSSINPTDFRPGNYAFTGERIIYVVVVRDLNGALDIENVHWMRDGDLESICTDVTDFVDVEFEEGEGDNGLRDAEYCFDMDRGELVESEDIGGGPNCNEEDNEIEIEISTSTNLQWDDQTDKLYKCVVEVEGNWEGESEIAVHASDKSDGEGMTVPEMWNFNPPLVVDIDTSDGEPLAFGSVILDQNAVFATEPNCVNVPTDGPEDLTFRDCNDYVACENDETTGYGAGEGGDTDEWQDCEELDAEKLCDVSFSTNKLKITNVGEVNLWAFIAATDFHASEGVARCPFDNTLSANQFEYRATSGSYDSGWRLMPEYSPNLGCAGIGLGDSENEGGADDYLDLVYGQCRGGCRIPAGGHGWTSGGAQTNPPQPGLDILSPTHHIEVMLKLVWPTPCIGTFDEGNVHVLVRAV
jgi:hypothetical protein